MLVDARGSAGARDAAVGTSAGGRVACADAGGSAVTGEIARVASRAGGGRAARGGTCPSDALLTVGALRPVAALIGWRNAGAVQAEPAGAAVHSCTLRIARATLEGGCGVGVGVAAVHAALRRTVKAGDARCDSPINDLADASVGASRRRAIGCVAGARVRRPNRGNA